jgi:hypothetical protein
LSDETGAQRRVTCPATSPPDIFVNLDFSALFITVISNALMSAGSQGRSQVGSIA